MSSRSFLSRVALLCLAGSLVACAGPQTSTAPPAPSSDVAPASPSGPADYSSPGQPSGNDSSVQPDLTSGSGADVSAGAGAAPSPASPPVQVNSQVLDQIPASIPQTYGQSSLQTISPDEFSTAFDPTTFDGQAGTYMGYAPGFDATLLGQSRFLPIDSMWIPYHVVEGRYVPLCFYDQAAGLYFYPTVVLVDGMFVPVYRVVTVFLDPYSIYLPVSIGAVFVSPVIIDEVPAPIAYEPEIIRPIPDISETVVINQITTIETNIVEPVTISPTIVARVDADRRQRLPELPARIRQRITELRDKGSPTVVPLTPAIEHNQIVRRQAEQRVRQEARKIAVPPPSHPGAQPERGVTPPQRGTAPPERGVTPPHRGATPPHRGATPPERGVTPPEHGVTPPERGATPPERRAGQPPQHHYRQPSMPQRPYQQPAMPQRQAQQPPVIQHPYQPPHRQPAMPQRQAQQPPVAQHPYQPPHQQPPHRQPAMPPRQAQQPPQPRHLIQQHPANPLLGKSTIDSAAPGSLHL